MARVVVTDPADADTEFIIGDLAAKAGLLVVVRYEADFDASTGAWRRSRKAVRHDRRSAASSASV